MVFAGLVLSAAAGLSLLPDAPRVAPELRDAPAAVDPLAGPWTVKVLVLRYFPTLPNGIAMDTQVTGPLPEGDDLQGLRNRVTRMTLDTRAILENGSRFRGYRDPFAKPSVRYEVVATIDRLEPVPPDPRKPPFPDYRGMLERENIKDWVQNKGIREVWIWGYHTEASAPHESNMAGPYGDVSNSDRDRRDLPDLGSTYTVYHYNYARGTEQAVHNHIHQLEALLREADPRMMERFEGTPGNWRSGNCHFPPNATKDYEYDSKTAILSDIEDWRPDGVGTQRYVNAERWGGGERGWYTFWMQSLPGARNGLTFRGKPLTNWWVFVADYDRARGGKLGLVGE